MLQGKTIEVSIQLISLTSREDEQKKQGDIAEKLIGFHSINFPNE